MKMWMKKVNNFQIAKIQPHLIFCQFQPGVAYKSVAYRKSVYTRYQFWFYS